jgi:hypothetical protein
MKMTTWYTCGNRVPGGWFRWCTSVAAFFVVNFPERLPQYGAGSMVSSTALTIYWPHFHCRIQSNSNWRFGQRWLYRRTRGRNMRFRWTEHSMTTRPRLTNRFGLRRVFIRLMKSLCVGTTADLNISNSRRSLGTCQGIHRIHYGS